MNTQTKEMLQSKEYQRLISEGKTPEDAVEILQNQNKEIINQPQGYSKNQELYFKKVQAGERAKKYWK